MIRIVFGTIDHEVHRKRRAAVSPFFSKTAVTSAEPMIYRKMDLLCQPLRDSLAIGGVVELRKSYLAMTTDTLCGHAFDKSLDLLDEDRKADEWKRTIRAVAILTPLIKQFTWIIPLALKLPLAPLRMVVPDLARIVALHRVGTNSSNASITGFYSA
jgi:cytochrome P450